MATRIDYTSMMGAGSKLALNGSTFGVGVQTGSLKSAASLAGTSGVSLSNGVLTIKQAGFVLDGYDLRGVGVVVAADNVTIKNSLGSPSTSGRYGIFQDKGASGLTVEYCTFDGQKSAGIGGNMVDTIINAYDGAMTIRNNEFINIPSDAINIQAGTVARNYFSGTGYQSGAHADAISVQATTAPVTIRENYIDAYKRADAPQEPNSAIKIVSHFGAINNVTVDSNVLVGGGYALYVSPAGNPISNVKITNNDIGMSNWGDLFPGDHGSGFVFQGNYNFVTNAHLLSGGASNPAPSPAPAQPAKPAPTPAPAPPAKPAPAPAPAQPAKPAPAPTPADPAPSNGADTSVITLRVSGDQYQGAPHFNVAVDGKVVATNLVATALHGNGQWADVKVATKLTPGAHKISVTFTDDAWGGAAAKDKNLYVDYIEVNGKRYQGETVDATSDPQAAALFSNGTVTFTTGTTTSKPAPAPTVPAPKPSPAPEPAQPGTSIPKATIVGTDRQDVKNGTAGNDVIQLKAGADVLQAKAGNDIIIGGGGKDWLSGQGGNDVFVYTSLGDSKVGAGARDEICDWGTLYGTGKDKLDLHLIDASTKTSGDQAFSWIGTKAFSGKAGELRSFLDGKNTVVEGDVNADGKADFQIQINGKAALSAHDFML